MAKKKANVNQMPEGFEPVSSQMDGFFVVEEGNQLRGIIRDSFTPRNQKFQPRPVYKIEVTSDDPPTRIVNKDVGETDAEVGALVGVDEKGYLKKLRDIPKGTEVFIRCMGKEDKPSKPGQQPAWVFMVGAAPAKRKTDEGEDDIPF